MSPFSSQLKTLRIGRGLRQSELANLLGYDQSYISSLELGTKGPPTKELVGLLISRLQLTFDEQATLLETVAASNRKINVPCDAPESVFWLFHRLRQQIDHLHPTQVSLMETALKLPQDFNRPVQETAPRIKRRYINNVKQEAEM
jgi:transcriptional regulator with XRE-family HTH domain